MLDDGGSSMIVLPLIFCLIHAPQGDYVSEYSNVDQTTVSQTVSQLGYPFEFIDEPTYNSFIQAHQVIVTPPSAQQLAYQTELSTTEAAVSAAAPNYVAANAITQIQVNKNMARIIQLRSLLGLQ
jgi:hypothetical protein